MRIQRSDAETITLSGLDPVLCELLREILPSADPGDSRAALERLYSVPTAGVDPEFDEEWREYVQPELRTQFQSHLAVVEKDLEQLSQKSGRRLPRLQIPLANVDHWINALNQARLALATRHEITEREMESEPDFDTARGRVLFRIFFYGFLQECFIREIT
jgi:hypothetical protein